MENSEIRKIAAIYLDVAGDELRKLYDRESQAEYNDVEEILKCEKFIDVFKLESVKEAIQERTKNVTFSRLFPVAEVVGFIAIHDLTQLDSAFLNLPTARNKDDSKVFLWESHLSMLKMEINPTPEIELIGILIEHINVTVDKPYAMNLFISDMYSKKILTFAEARRLRGVLEMADCYFSLSTFGMRILQEDSSIYPNRKKIEYLEGLKTYVNGNFIMHKLPGFHLPDLYDRIIKAFGYKTPKGLQFRVGDRECLRFGEVISLMQRLNLFPPISNPQYGNLTRTILGRYKNHNFRSLSNRMCEISMDLEVKFIESYIEKSNVEFMIRTNHPDYMERAKHPESTENKPRKPYEKPKVTKIENPSSEIIEKFIDRVTEFRRISRKNKDENRAIDNGIREIKVLKVHKDAKIPKFAHDEEDAAADLFSVNREFVKNQVRYKTGICVAIPKGYVGLLFPRSSVRNKDLICTNSVGVIDSGYRGEIEMTFTIVENNSEYSPEYSPETYKVGDRIGQLMLVKLPNFRYVAATEEEWKKMEPTSRGTGGHGSTNEEPGTIIEDDPVSMHPPIMGMKEVFLKYLRDAEMLAKFIESNVPNSNKRFWTEQKS